MKPHKLAIEKIEDGKNLFITGGAGTGKSWTVNRIVEWAEENDIEVARTALTGMASLQIPNGETLHRCLGLGFGKDRGDLEKVVNGYKFENETQHNIKFLDLLIIDEVSMLRSDLLGLVNGVLQVARGNMEQPFGGLQVILCGDFMQLPPVVKNEERQKFNDGKYWPFKSEVWDDLDLDIIYLTEIKRQDDKHFAKALNCIRAGYVTDDVNQYFAESQSHEFPSGIEPVKLMTTNRSVDLVNNRRLSMIQKDLETYKCKTGGRSEKFIEKLKKDCRAEDNLKLKVGAQIMIIINDPNGGFVNGTMGEYLGTKQVRVTKINYFTGSEVEKLVTGLKVRLLESNRTVLIPPFEWRLTEKSNGKEVVLATLEQYPVRLAWAITVHKSQGMSIDYLEVDLMNCFAEGQAYVALSRAKTYEGLRVKNWRPGVVRCDPHAYDYYMNLKEKGVI